MAAPITFYFEFSSPYGYLAARQIEALSARHGCSVDWKPYLMGVVMKQTGMVPLIQVPLKGDYMKLDLQRTARAEGFEFVLPDPFPFLAVAASRAFYWLHDRDPALAVRFARAVYDAAFMEGRDMSRPDAVAEVGAGLGIDKDELRAALKDEAVKDRLRDETDKAIEAGAFGSPFVIVDGEPFWGFDKFPEIERWLESGGW